MKRNILSLIIFICGTLAMSSCTKEGIKPPYENAVEEVESKGPPAAQHRIKTRTKSGYTENFVYDAQGRSLGITGPYAWTLQYPDANHVIETPYASGVVNYELNSKGLASYALLENWQNWYFYNSKKQIVEKFIQDNAGPITRVYYTYSNGNLTKMDVILDGQLDYSVTYSYYLDKPNGLDPMYFGQSFRGVESKNLMKQRVTDFGFDIAVEDFEYDFDPLGRVILQKTKYKGAYLPDVTFTYY